MNLHLINNFIHQPSNILDVGANIGNFSKQCKILWPNCYTVSIEANDQCEPLLKLNCDEYKIALLSNIDNKKMEYFIDKNNLYGEGNSVYKELNYTDYYSTIKTSTTLDTLFKATNKVFDIIKIDTQGSELDIIKGGHSIINTSRCVILELSLVQYNDNSPMYKEVMLYMIEMGFFPAVELNKHYLNGKIIQTDMAFINHNRV